MPEVWSGRMRWLGTVIMNENDLHLNRHPLLRNNKLGDIIRTNLRVSFQPLQRGLAVTYEAVEQRARNDVPFACCFWNETAPMQP